MLFNAVPFFCQGVQDKVRHKASPAEEELDELANHACSSQ